MYGPDDIDATTRQNNAVSITTENLPMTRQDIDRCIARAHRLRAEQLAAWGRNVARTWRSLFRRPGRLLPTQARAGSQMIHSTQH